MPTSHGQEEDHYFGPFRISVTERVLRRDGRIIPLSPKCFETLLTLARHAGNVVDKETLMRTVWPDSFVEDGNLAQNIFTLRKVLGELPGGGQYIQTITKRGYRLVVPPPSADCAAATPPAHVTPAPVFARPVRRVWYMVVAGALAASVLMAVLWVSPGDRAAAPRFVRIAIPNGLVYAIISPDGQRVAYVSEDSNRQSLWIRGTSGVGAGIRLTKPAAGHFFGVSFAPGGDFLYYAFEDGEPPAASFLYRVPAEGGEPQRLLADAASAPSFSPDGRLLVFKRYDINGRGRLFIATALGAHPRLVATSDASYAFYNYRWSPDGENIYYVEGTGGVGGGWSLKEVSVAGGNPRLVMPPQPRALRSANWLNRSEVLAVTPDDDSGGAQIWRMGTGEAPRRITSGLANYWLISLTADGRTLLANSIDTDDSIWTAPATGESHGDPGRLSLPAGSYNDPAWMPDGRIVFAGQFNLWLVSADGLQRRTLLREPVNATEAVVSPDGGSVVFVMQRQGTRNLWQAGINGGALRQVTTGQMDWHPALSPDGKWVLYVANLPGHREICKAPLDRSGPARKLVDTGGTDLAVSADNQLFASVNDVGEMQIRSLEDGSLVRRMNAPADATDLQWTPDGKALLYVAGPNGAKQVWRQAIAEGSTPRPGRLLPGNVRRVTWSADCTRIAYLQREMKVEPVLITNFR